MPLIQCSLTGPVEDEQKRAFAAAVTDRYTEEMATSAGHVAVTLAGRRPSEMAVGRGVEGPMFFLRAAVREGRPFERKRAFALAAMEAAGRQFGVPDPKVKVVSDEHPGEHMMCVDRVGGEWSPDGEG